MKKVILTILCLGVLTSLHAQQFAKVGTAGAQFLKIGAGARMTGMGGACMALVDDASAIFWNPGALVRVENFSLFTSHVEWMADIRYEAIGIAKTLPGIGSVGLSASLLTSGDMDITTYQQQEGTGETFSKTDMLIGLTFARYLTDRFSFGGSVKYVRENYGTENTMTGEGEIASALAFDIGAIYQTGFRSLRMGISIQNFGPELQIPGQYEDITGYDSKAQEYVHEPAEDYRPYHMPLMFRVGIAMDLFESEMNKITVTSDLIHPNDNVEQILIGGEYWFRGLLALRGGFIGNHDAAKFAAGGSVKFSLSDNEEASLDYSYTDYGILDMVHQMSLVVNF